MVRTKPKVPTFTRYALKTIMPAVGWQSVWELEGAHTLEPVHALALATRRLCHAETGQLIPDRLVESEDEDWYIVGLDYHPIDGWNVVDGVDGETLCCGLLPPGMTLAEFEAMRDCLNSHRAAQATQGV